MACHALPVNVFAENPCARDAIPFHPARRLRHGHRPPPHRQFRPPARRLPAADRQSLSVRAAQRSSAENLYAPFYLWNSSAGMSDFLTDEGFRGSARRSAGRVSIIGCRGWRISIALIWPGPPGRPVRSRLSPLQRSACAASATAGGPGALASIVAFDPADWRLVRLDLWREPPQSPCKTASCSASAICPPL